MNERGEYHFGRALLLVLKLLFLVTGALARLMVRAAWLILLLLGRWFMWAMRSWERAATSLVGAALGFLLLVIAVKWIEGEVRALIAALLDGLPHPPGVPGVNVGAPHLSAPGALQPALLVLASAMIALLVVRLVCTELTLRGRVAYAVLPSQRFDPGQAHVQAFASHLVGMRRRVLAWVDRPASAFRVRLTTTGKPRPGEGQPATVSSGRPLMVWEFPSRFQSLLSTAASCYPAVDLVPLEEFEAPPAGRLSGRRHTVCLELQPANQLYPLRDQPYPSNRSGVDPLQSAAAALRQVKPERGDRLEVAVDLLPLAPREGVRARKRMLQKARGMEAKGKSSDVAESVSRRLHRQGITEKAGPALPLFGVQILVHAEASCTGAWWRRLVPGLRCCPGHKRARSMAGRVFACFDQFAGQNYLRARGLSIFGQVHLGAGLPLARQWFELRLRRGLMG